LNDTGDPRAVDLLSRVQRRDDWFSSGGVTELGFGFAMRSMQASHRRGFRLNGPTTWAARPILPYDA